MLRPSSFPHLLELERLWGCQLPRDEDLFLGFLTTYTPHLRPGLFRASQRSFKHWVAEKEARWLLVGLRLAIGFPLATLDGPRGN